eukprot:Nitzschia sp. Nitz4//scaffold36_size144017//93475//94468//NITZ4_003102-RA/size144017-snap-gene-0.213-mRNA-1//-1//CDS//3329549504//6434//frame0
MDSGNMTNSSSPGLADITASLASSLGDVNTNLSLPGDVRPLKDLSVTPSLEKPEQSKRFIPDHKKPDAALTFPEKLMNLMKHAEAQNEEDFCVAWLSDGKSFVIRNPDEFTRKVLPLFFKATKFSSFTRKLYRWGFRQVNRGIGPDDPIIFGNEFFQRDNHELMVNMKSVTAATTRKQSDMQLLAQKRALESFDTEQSHKRVLFDHFMNQQKNMINPTPLFKNSGGMNLAQALRPNASAYNGFNGVKPFDMFAQTMNTPNTFMNSFPQNGLAGLTQNQNQNQFGNQSSTADIVNAAINALRFAP